MRTGGEISGVDDAALNTVASVLLATMSEPIGTLLKAAPSVAECVVPVSNDTSGSRSFRPGAGGVPCRSAATWSSEAIKADAMNSEVCRAKASRVFCFSESS